MDNILPAAWLTSAGAWVGFVVTLLIFSAIFGDHLLARLGQYVLVGAALGYAVVVTWQSILALDLIAALRAAPAATPWAWLPVMLPVMLPVILAVIMTLAGLERIFAQGRAGAKPRAWQMWLRTLGAIPALGLVALGVAVALVGAVQGTLAPQFLHVARSSLTWNAPLAEFIVGALTLLLTTAALIFFVIDLDRHLDSQPAWAQRMVRSWVWIGQRALWLAAGALFARLFASRLALLIATLGEWLWFLQGTAAGRLIEEWWRTLMRA